MPTPNDGALASIRRPVIMKSARRLNDAGRWSGRGSRPIASAMSRAAAASATPAIFHREGRLADTRGYRASAIAPAISATWAMRDPLSHTPPASAAAMAPQIARGAVVARRPAMAKAMHAPMAKYDPAAFTSPSGPLARALTKVAMPDEAPNACANDTNAAATAPAEKARSR